jgi:hypothetical protein
MNITQVLMVYKIKVKKKKGGRRGRRNIQSNKKRRK